MKELVVELGVAELMLELGAKGSQPVVKLWIAKLMMELGAAELMIRWARDGLMRK